MNDSAHKHEFVSAHELEFTVLPLSMVPEIPDSKGHKESKLRTALRELPAGGFTFIKGDPFLIRKRVSDMCSRIKRNTKNRKDFSIRVYELDGVEGLGVWRVDKDPSQAKKLFPTNVPWPNKEQMMSGK